MGGLPSALHTDLRQQPPSCRDFSWGEANSGHRKCKKSGQEAKRRQRQQPSLEGSTVHSSCTSCKPGSDKQRVKSTVADFKLRRGPDLFDKRGIGLECGMVRFENLPLFPPTVCAARKRSTPSAMFREAPPRFTAVLEGSSRGHGQSGARKAVAVEGRGHRI